MTDAATARGARIDDLPALWDGFAKLVREGLGITAFGVQVMDLPPDYRTKSHSESESDQEELYVALRGSGAVIVHGADGDEELALDAERLVFCPPQVERTLGSGSDGLRVLCVGAPRGRGYEAPEWTRGE